MHLSSTSTVLDVPSNFSCKYYMNISGDEHFTMLTYCSIFFPSISAIRGQRSTMKVSAVIFLAVVAMAMGEKPFTCPPLWSLYHGHCYRYFGERLTWDDAQTECEQHFTERGVASLVSVHSDAENAFVYDMFRSSRMNPRVNLPVSMEGLCSLPGSPKQHKAYDR